MIESISKLQGNGVGDPLRPPGSVPLVLTLDDAAEEVLKCCEDHSLYEVYILPMFCT